MRKRDDAVVLDEYIEEVRRGLNLTGVFVRCPKHLRPLLLRAIQTNSMPQVAPPEGVRERLFEKIKARQAQEVLSEAA